MSIHPGSSIGLWAHEWKKHGSCGSSSPLLKDQKAYFETTVNTLENLKLLNWLEDENIFPTKMSDSASYPIRDIHRAIEKHTGTKTYLDCKRIQGVSEPLLSGVFVCLDPETLKLTDCVRTDYRRCGSRNVKFISN